MKPLLASLVLLLLALCRQSSSTAVSWTSVNTMSSGSTVSIKADTKVAKEAVIKKYAPKLSDSEADKKKLLELIIKFGNTIWYLGLKADNKYDGSPDFYKKAVDNGVLCELANPKLPEDISQLLYGTDKPDGAHRTDEVAAAPADFKCDAGTPNPCFCTETKPLLYCMALQMTKDIKTTKGTCRDVALTNLGTAAPTLTKAISDASELTKIPSWIGKPAEEAIKAMTVNENVEAANGFCEMADEKVSKAVKELYAADALLWTLEEVFWAAAKAKKPIKEVCDSDPEAKTNPILKCVCALEKGFIMCFFEFIGTYFKTEGYLDCESSPKKFNADKKPKSLPAGLLEKSPSTSTASSLMMVPLMAAAVLLARH